MKRHVAAVVALLSAALVIDSHVDWVSLDGAQLMEVNGQRFDLPGWGREQALKLRRDCSSVPPLASDTATARAVLAVIQQHSLPDSRSARALQVRQLGEWSITEVAFDTLNPSLVVLHWQDGQWRVQDRAVWSGSTAPWHSADFVRRYLRRQAPAMPPALLNCVTVDRRRYGMGPARLGPASSLAELTP